MTLYQGGEAKIKKLKGILTPEVYAKQYDLVIGLLANGLSSKDMDELQAKLTGSYRDRDDILAQLKLVARLVPKNTNPEIVNVADKHNTLSLRGSLPVIKISTSLAKDVEFHIWYNMDWLSQKWRCQLGCYATSIAAKSFDDDGAAVKWLLKQIELAPEKVRKMYES